MKEFDVIVLFRDGHREDCTAYKDDQGNWYLSDDGDIYDLLNRLDVNEIIFLA